MLLKKKEMNGNYKIGGGGGGGAVTLRTINIVQNLRTKSFL